MQIAYSLTGHDNDSYFFESAPGNVFCQQCGSCVDKSYLPDNMTIRRKYDIGSSYDGRDIVSARFKEFCDEHYPGEAAFYQVTRDADFFYMVPKLILAFDAEKRRTRFLEFCPACGNYKSICGATPGVLKNQAEPIERGFFRTDLEFGSGREKSPVIIIGLKTKQQITEKRFGKPSFNPVYNDLPSPRRYC